MGQDLHTFSQKGQFQTQQRPIDTSISRFQTLSDGERPLRVIVMTSTRAVRAGGANP